jgi:hypothetical protein
MRFILRFKNKNNGAPKDALYTIMVFFVAAYHTANAYGRLPQKTPFLLLSLARPENYLFQFQPFYSENLPLPNAQKSAAF